MTLNNIFQQKPIFRMTSRQGRTRSVGVICGTGNGNGLFGYALATAVDARPAVNRAKKRAAQRLMYIPRHEDRTSENTSFEQLWIRFYS